MVAGPLAPAPPRDEMLRLTELGFRHVLACFGASRLIGLGLLDPGAETGAAGR